MAAAGRLTCVLVVSLGLGLTACTSSSHGSSPAPTGGSSATAPITEPAPAAASSAQAALGDFRTLDPCSLVDPTALQRLGQVTFGDPQSLDYCVVRLAPSNLELHIGELVSATTSLGGQRLAGGQQVISGAPGQTSCTDQLAFSDQVTLLTTATPSSGAATAASCSAAGAALQGVLNRISGGDVAHRAYPAKSFGPVDACAVLTAKIVSAAVPTIGAATAVTHPAKHQCEYGSAQSTYVALLLAAAYARFDGGPGSTTATIAKHQVVFVPEQPDGRAGECVGYGPHIAFPSKSGQPAMEMAELHVALSAGATDDAACAAVRSLAAPVFAHLP